MQLTFFVSHVLKCIKFRAVDDTKRGEFASCRLMICIIMSSPGRSTFDENFSFFDIYEIQSDTIDRASNSNQKTYIGRTKQRDSRSESMYDSAQGLLLCFTRHPAYDAVSVEPGSGLRCLRLVRFFPRSH